MFGCTDRNLNHKLSEWLSLLRKLIKGVSKHRLNNLGILPVWRHGSTWCLVHPIRSRCLGIHLQNVWSVCLLQQPGGKKQVPRRLSCRLPRRSVYCKNLRLFEIVWQTQSDIFRRASCCFDRGQGWTNQPSQNSEKRISKSSWLRLIRWQRISVSLLHVDCGQRQKNCSCF